MKILYFSVTKGKNRIISKAEVLGRLNFCGFKVIGVKEIDEDMYFVVQKVKTPSLDQSPSYGPFVTLKRKGFNNKIICIYKFRTMYPYSEYLQEYIYELNKLQEGGKFKDDFRMTTWGRFMRKTWIDELPMLYNWLKGEVRFFGVRPLSLQYFSMYSKDLQEMRKKVKPGLVPPFYADMPKTFDDICESERRYIQAYLEKPKTTQLIYIFKAFSNIVLKGARSR